MPPRKIYVSRMKHNIAMHISQPVNNFLSIYFLCRFKHISNELHRTESKRARASECLNIMMCRPTDAAYAYKQRVMSTANFSMPPPVRQILENWFHGVHRHHYHGLALPSKSMALSTSLRQAERSAARRLLLYVLACVLTSSNKDMYIVCMYADMLNGGQS